MLVSKGTILRRAWRLLADLSLFEASDEVVLLRADWTLPGALVYVVQFVLFNLVGIFDDLETFLGKSAMRARYEADCIADVVRVATQQVHSLGRSHVLAKG